METKTFKDALITVSLSKLTRLFLGDQVTWMSFFVALNHVPPSHCFTWICKKLLSCTGRLQSCGKSLLNPDSINTNKLLT